MHRRAVGRAKGEVVVLELEAAQPLELLLERGRVQLAEVRHAVVVAAQALRAQHHDRLGGVARVVRARHVVVAYQHDIGRRRGRVVEVAERRILEACI